MLPAHGGAAVPGRAQALVSERLRRIAEQVLTGVPSASTELSWAVDVVLDLPTVSSASAMEGAAVGTSGQAAVEGSGLARLGVRRRQAVRVHFDRSSHSSGVQRGFIKCPHTGHTRCFKYRSVTVDADHRRLAAWLCAWALGALVEGPGFPKPARMKHTPPEDLVEACLQQMPGS